MSVTLRDVAKAAGVSVSTASRALHDPGSTTEATRLRVREVAEELQYHPNTAARSLRTRRTDTIGLLVPDVRNPFFTDLAYSVDKAAAAAGLTVMIGNSDESTSAADRFLTNLARHQVDGLLVVPQGLASEALEQAAADRPTVFLDRHPDLPGVSEADVPVVTSGDTDGMVALIDHVVAQGYRRIGFISGPTTASTGRARHAAFVRRLGDLGLPNDESLVAYGDFRLQSGLCAAEELLAPTRSSPPTTRWPSACSPNCADAGCASAATSASLRSTTTRGSRSSTLRSRWWPTTRCGWRAPRSPRWSTSSRDARRPPP